MKWLVSYLCGVVFALGLGISGMTDPTKVTGFLDVFGQWDASLALVMVGAIGVNLVPSVLSLRRTRPVLDVRYHLAPFQHVDTRLVGGSVLFGVGWGLAGYCPGPALVSAGVGLDQALAFVLAMAGGMALWHLVTALGTSPGPVSLPVTAPRVFPEPQDG